LRNPFIKIMTEQYYKMVLAEYPIYYQLRNETAAKWFEWHICPANEIPDYAIRLTDEILEKNRSLFSLETPEDYMEYRLLVSQTCRLLAENERFIIHSVAFIWKGLAWLLTAPSGTGKTTQFKLWKTLWPDEVRILCGDMPLLHIRPDEKIWVYPSPWNGNERFGFNSHDPIPLGGIVYLEQGVNNKIEAADLHKIILPLWNQDADYEDTELQIRSRAYFFDYLLSCYPVWMLINRGDRKSAMMTRYTIEQYLQEKKE